VWWVYDPSPTINGKEKGPAEAGPFCFA
jgi:hypothetical protein